MYDLAVVLDLESHTLLAEEEILYPNPSKEPLDNLLLVVETNQTADVFMLQKISLGASVITDFELNRHELSIPLFVPIPPGCGVEINLMYTLSLPQEAGIFGFTESQATLSNWYPFVPLHQEDGWLVHPPGAYGEHLVYPAADYRVKFQLRGESDQNILIAASSPAEEIGPKFFYAGCLVWLQQPYRRGRWDHHHGLLPASR